MSKITTIDIKSFSKEICGVKDEFTRAFFIGGTALTLQKLQSHTGDVDLVVQDRHNLESICRRLLAIGFKYFSEEQSQEKKDKPVCLIRDRMLVDIFVKRTTHYSLTDSMIERSIKEVKENNMEISVISPEDILVLKTATGRQSDAKLFIKIIKENDIDWSIVISELKEQNKIGNIRVFHDFLCTIHESQSFDDVSKYIPLFVIEEVMNSLRDQYDLFLTTR